MTQGASVLNVAKMLRWQFLSSFLVDGYRQTVGAWRQEQLLHAVKSGKPSMEEPFESFYPLGFFSVFGTKKILIDT